MLLVFFSINVSIFHSTWLDTFWTDLVYSFKVAFSVSSDIFLEVDLLGHKAVPFLIF